MLTKPFLLIYQHKKKCENTSEPIKDQIWYATEIFLNFLINRIIYNFHLRINFKYIFIFFIDVTILIFNNYLIISISIILTFN